MINKLNGLADSLVARIVPQAKADACPHTYYDYRCNNGRQQRRTCYRNVECYTLSCGNWSGTGKAC